LSQGCSHFSGDRAKKKWWIERETEMDAKVVMEGEEGGAESTHVK